MSDSRDKTLAPPRPEVLPHDQRLVIEYLLSEPGRTISNHVAIMELGIGSLSSRIAELRKLGFKIVDTFKRDFHGVRYKAYWLESPDGDKKV